MACLDGGQDGKLNRSEASLGDGAYRRSSPAWRYREISLAQIRAESQGNPAFVYRGRG